MRRIFKREIESLALIYDFAQNLLAQHEVSEKDAFAIQLVLEELFTNMVKYNPDGPSEVEINLKIGQHKISVEIVDESEKPFDLTVSSPVVDPQASLEARKVGGLGLHLVHRLMDEVKYSYKNKKSTVVVVKTLEQKHVGN